MKHTTSTHFHGFLLDENGLPAEIDGPADLVDLADRLLSVPSAARTSRAARRANCKRARQADLEVEVFLAAINKHFGPVPG